MEYPVLNFINEATRGTLLWGRVYLVGGAVRDSLLGFDESGDLDLVVDGDGDELVDCLIESGILDSEPVRFPRFGTAMVQIHSQKVEIVGARKESYEAGSRKPLVERATLQHDAERRDFTCNALMQRLSDGLILDPLGFALDDIQNRRLRTPSNSDNAFRDDPLRLLRAVRFRWQLGFEPAAGLWESVGKNAPYLKSISRERIQEELSKIVMLENFTMAFEDMKSVGLVKQFWPIYPEHESINPSLGVKFPRHLEARLACLLVLAAGPEEKDLAIIKKFLVELKYSNQVIHEVLKLITGVWWLRKSTDFSRIGARRFLSQFYDERAMIFAIAEARLPSNSEISGFSALVNQESKLFAKWDLESPLDGHEIKEVLGVADGKDIGRIKGYLRDLVISGDLVPGDMEEAKSIVMKVGRNLIKSNDVQ